MLTSAVQTPARAPHGVAPAAPQTPAPTNPVPALASSPGGDLATMRIQLGDLNAQLAGLRAQWNGLQRQLESMLKSNPARPPVQAKAADVGVQIAQVEGQVATLRAQIAQREGIPVSQVSQTGQTIAPPPYMPRSRGPDPDVIVGLSFTLILAVAFPLAVGYARRLWRGKPQPTAARTDEILPRLDRLEQAMDAIAIEIERVSEGQRFVTKILAERPATQAAAPRPVAEPIMAAGAEPPLRALGAGPAEPVRVPERQAMRASVTPH